MSHPPLFLVILGLAPAAVTGGIGPAPAPGVRLATDSAIVARIDSMYAHLTRDTAPGFSVVVVRDGRVLLTRGYGFASLEHRVPVTPATVFDAASVSKQFTGLAVSMLVTRGAIALDDDIRRYIPELHDFGTPITISHLVHHTSGIRDWPATLSVAGWRFDDVISMRQILSMAYAQRTLNFPPGSEYTYSNTGYNLLAELVARVSGRAFADWTREEIFQPLGMSSTGFRDDHTVVVPRLASGYARAADGSWRRTPNELTALGSSSMLTTAEDLGRWLINLGTGEVGGSGAMTLMRNRGVLTRGDTIPYAFGISHGSYRGLASISHSGSWASFSTWLQYFPEQRFGIAVLANSGTVPASRIANSVTDLYLEGELSRLVTADSAPPAPADVPAAILDRYVGLYRLGPAWYVRITRDGSQLVARATASWGVENPAPMIARSETGFWVPAYGSSITFEVDERGHTPAFRYRGMRATRVDDPAPPTAEQLGALAGSYVSDELHTRYRVVASDSGLVLWHFRHGEMPLRRVALNDFTAGQWFLASIDFRRDEAGRVTGIMVNAGERSRDNWFRRE